MNMDPEHKLQHHVNSISIIHKLKANIGEPKTAVTTKDHKGRRRTTQDLKGADTFNPFVRVDPKRAGDLLEYMTKSVEAGIEATRAVAAEKDATDLKVRTMADSYMRMAEALRVPTRCG